MSQTQVNSVLALSGFPPLVPNVPPAWMTTPNPNKISLLWNSNYHELYHKFSPYTNYNYNILGSLLSDQQPFVYTYIDEFNDQLISSLPNAAQAVLSTININQDTINDVTRVSKFLVSSWGVQFLASQILIQRLQPFDETRLYNPLSPLLATVQPMSLGLLDRPMRHIEPSVSGLLSSIGLGGILGIGGYATPSSTAGDAALSTYNSGQGKGLIRGGDASVAAGNFNTAFPVGSTLGITGGIISSLKSAIGQIFGGTPNQPPGTVYRADETSYATMAISSRLNFGQMWYPNPQTKADQPLKSLSILSQINSTISTVANVISNPASLIGNALSSLFPSSTNNHNSTFKRTKVIVVPDGFLYVNATQGYDGPQIKGRNTGYSITNNSKYTNVIAETGDGIFTNSDMLIQFGFYADSDYNYDSKFSDPLADDAKVTRVSKTLQDVIKNINTYNLSYIINTSTYSKLLSSGDTPSIGYNPLFNNIPAAASSPVGTYGVISEYSTGTDIKGAKSTNNINRLPATLDKRVNSNKNLRFATTFTSDGLNQLSVLKANNKNPLTVPFSNPRDPSLSSTYPTWTEYNPYEDDLIAFYFYDIVNKKYIPFRATVKGISEGNTAFWDELRFLGRADQLYSYNGYSRTLSFSFNIIINSITELLPSWKKINYLASAVKPSNYTRSDTVANIFDRFIVPPMFMITIGDLYRFQPIVLRSITVNIPEDALWETLNEYNSDEWNYLNGIIKAKSVSMGYGQLPREAEISVEGALLEKERAQIGGSHFGHAPRVDDWEKTTDSNGNLTDSSFFIGSPNTDDSIFLPKPSYLHKQMIVPNPSTEPATK